jgi:hypothetical protein
MPAPDASAARVLDIIGGDAWSMAVLRTVRVLALPDWAVGAGFVRTPVWDALSGHAERTPLGDIDVLYFEPANLSKEREAALEARLAVLMPGEPWSVRNQARMHLRNGDPPYRDTCDALSFWLETPTCVAVRLEANDRLSLLAPYGLEDLLAMRSRPTPHGRAKPDQYRARMEAKNWTARWPAVQIEP